MGEVVFVVEPDSAGGRWFIKRGDSIRATYTARAQAVADARQLALFESELRGRTAVVCVLDAERRVTENLVFERAPQRAPARAAIRPGGARFLLR